MNRTIVAQTLMLAVVVSTGCKGAEPSAAGSCGGPGGRELERPDGCVYCSECAEGWLCPDLACHWGVPIGGACIEQPCLIDRSDEPGLQPDCVAWVEDEDSNIVAFFPSCEVVGGEAAPPAAAAVCVDYLVGESLPADCAAEDYAAAVRPVFASPASEQRYAELDEWPLKVYCHAPELGEVLDGRAECWGPGPQERPSDETTTGW